jgi:hypothetical protein
MKNALAVGLFCEGSVRVTDMTQSHVVAEGSVYAISVSLADNPGRPLLSIMLNADGGLDIIDRYGTGHLTLPSGQKGTKTLVSDRKWPRPEELDRDAGLRDNVNAIRKPYLVRPLACLRQRLSMDQGVDESRVAMPQTVGDFLRLGRSYLKGTPGLGRASLKKFDALFEQRGWLAEWKAS